jgi:hypothetical protein
MKQDWTTNSYKICFFWNSSYVTWIQT